MKYFIEGIFVLLFGISIKKLRFFKISKCLLLLRIKILFIFIDFLLLFKVIKLIFWILVEDIDLSYLVIVLNIRVVILMCGYLLYLFLR